MVAPAGPGIGKAKDAQVMGALKGKTEAPKKAKLTMPQIIESSLKTEQPGIDIPKAFTVLAEMTYMVNQKKGKFIQIGNTVIVATPSSPEVAEIHTFTVEPPETLSKRYKSAANTLKQLGFKKAVSYAQSPAFVKIAQNTGLPVKVSQSQQMIGNKMVPAYKFELDL